MVSEHPTRNIVRASAFVYTIILVNLRRVRVDGKFKGIGQSSGTIPMSKGSGKTGLK